MKIGWSVRAVREQKKIKTKNKKFGHQRYISGMRRSVTPIGGMMKLGTLVEPSDVMNHAKFHLHQMNILGASGGSKTRICL